MGYIEVHSKIVNFFFFFFKRLIIVLNSISFARPLLRIIGFFVLAINRSIKGRLLNSPDAIFQPSTFNFKNLSKSSKEKTDI